MDGKSVTVEDVLPAVMPVFEAEIARRALELERRAMDQVQRAIDRMPMPKDGKDGEKGADGRDGLGWEDFSWDQDEDGRLLAKYQRGDVVSSVRVPCVVFRGLFIEGTPYMRGDSVTWGGGQWIALRDNDGSVKPDQIVKDGPRVWQLSVMRGKQGTAGQKGEKGDPGVNGRDGKDIVREKW